jgi:hypothetical protein
VRGRVLARLARLEARRPQPGRAQGPYHKPPPSPEWWAEYAHVYAEMADQEALIRAVLGPLRAADGEAEGDR